MAALSRPFAARGVGCGRPVSAADWLLHLRLCFGLAVSSIGALQTALYALIVLAAGVLLYRETVTPVQLVGILLAVGGVVLINWR